jgi:hypothetical protein
MEAIELSPRGPVQKRSEPVEVINLREQLDNFYRFVASNKNWTETWK